MEDVTRLDRYGWASPEDEEQPSDALALYSQQGDRDDPCAKASLTLGVQPDLPTRPRDQRGSKRLVMKRKVLRHRPDGGVEISDESATSELESEAESSLRQKMLQLRSDDNISSNNISDDISNDNISDDISEGEIETSSSSHDECPGDIPPFVLRDFRSCPTCQCTTASGQPKSFIPPRFEPLGRNRGKTDRLAKYLEYKREWEKFHIPGEDQQQALRWCIREQLLCQPELPSKPQAIYIPNTYTVPTEKKRAALRWEVRWDLANGLLPRKTTS